MRLGLFRSIRLTALLCATWSSVALGAAAASKPAAAPEPPHVDFTKIATSAENAAIEIRGIEAGLVSDSVVPEVSSNLPALSQEIDARLYESSNILQASPSLETLRTLDEDWHTIDTQLMGWKTKLDERRNWTIAKQGDLRYGISLWEGSQEIAATNEKHIADRLSGNDQDRLFDTLTNLKSTLHDVNAKLNEIETLYSQTDEQEARVGFFLSDLKDAQSQAYNRLLSRDAPPIWYHPLPVPPTTQPSTTTGSVVSGQSSIKAQLSGVEAYLTRNGGRFFPHLLLLVVLIVVFFWVRRRIKARVDDNPRLAEAVPVFRSPVAIALVIWFMVGLWIYPHAPRMFWAIAVSLALIPTVWLLRGLLAPRLFPLLSALVVFYFVDQVRVVLAAQAELSRWVFLGEMAVALVAVLLLLRANRHDDAAVKAGWIGRIVRTATWLAVLFLSAAVIGDIVGFVSLSRLLGDATLRSAYLGLILYAALRIVDALLVLAINGRPLVLLGVVRKHGDLILLRTQQAVQWLAMGFWGLLVLQLFWVREQAFTYTHEVLNTSIGLGSFHFTPGHVLAFAIIIWASFLVSRFIRFVLEEDVYGRFSLPTGIPYAISKMLNYVVLLAGFFMALGALGFQLTNFAILASAFTVGIGFGLQNIVNNFVSGIILLFERPVKVGDVVQLGDAAGVVGQIGIRASVIRTTGGAEVIVPNALFISSQVTNWTLSNSQRAIEIDVNVAAGPKPNDVIDLLTRVASAHPLISDSPRPVGMLAKFTVDTYSYELHAWTDRVESWMSIRSDLTVAVSDALAAANMAVK